VALAVGAALGLRTAVGVVIAEAQAQSAADAVALRAAEVDCESARVVLGRGRARLVSCAVDGLDAVVVVEVAGRTATARASRSPRAPSGGVNPWP